MDTSLTPVTLIKLSYSFAFILNRGTTKTSLSKNASACVKIHIYYINTRRLLRACRQQRINLCKTVTFVNSNGAYFVCQYFIIFVIEMWHLSIKILESSNQNKFQNGLYKQVILYLKYLETKIPIFTLKFQSYKATIKIS